MQWRGQWRAVRARRQAAPHAAVAPPICPRHAPVTHKKQCKTLPLLTPGKLSTPGCYTGAQLLPVGCGVGVWRRFSCRILAVSCLSVTCAPTPDWHEQCGRLGCRSCGRGHLAGNHLTACW
eukprot:2836346-Rhodomonas_salina.6